MAVVAERQGRFLMVEEQVQGVMRFNQPAGHLEDREGLIEAAIRECREETAWQFQPEALVGIYRWRNHSNGDTYLRASFCGSCVTQDTDLSLDADISAVHWMSLEEIRARGDALRSPLVLRSLNDYLAGRRYPLDLLADVP